VCPAKGSGELVSDLALTACDLRHTAGLFLHARPLAGKQPISSILEAAVTHKAHAVGMSGLLVKSTVVMRENLEG
jgi:hypothetical protein